MSTPHSSDRPGAPDRTPPVCIVPPPLSPHMPAPKRGLSPLAIVAICAGAFGMLVVVGLLAIGLLMTRKYAQAQASTARQMEAERALAMAADARAADAHATQPSGAVSFAPRRIEPGLSHTNIRVASEPWSIHVLKIDRSQKDLTFFSAHARDKVLGVSLLRDQARAVPREIGRAIAGVNGDFYIRDTPPYSGDPRGLQIMNGDLISAPDTVCMWFDTAGNPHLDEVRGDFQVIWPDGRKTPFGLNQQRKAGTAVLYTPTYGVSTLAAGGREFVLEKEGDGPWLPLQASQNYRARVREVRTDGNTRFAPDAMVLSLAPQLLTGVPEVAAGTVLQISTATTPDLKGVKAAIGGGPALVKDGRSAFTQKTPPPNVSRDFSQRSKYERHPRTAVGWSPTHVYLVIVDGRQPGLSVGMKLAELADFFLSLGCTDAMNLDGGKSAQMWMNGRIMNDPCQGEDTVASSLLVVRKSE